MRLSEAIRLGAMVKPQAFGYLEVTYIYPTNGPLGLDRSFSATCAIGAAMEAVGLELCSDSAQDFFRCFPEAVMIWELPCPVCGALERGGPVPHLNNDHLWTRERIANWVETIERASLTDRSDASEPVAAVARTADLVTG